MVLLIQLQKLLVVLLRQGHFLADKSKDTSKDKSKDSGNGIARGVARGERLGHPAQRFGR